MLLILQLVIFTACLKFKRILEESWTTGEKFFFTNYFILDGWQWIVYTRGWSPQLQDGHTHPAAPIHSSTLKRQGTKLYILLTYRKRFFSSLNWGLNYTRRHPKRQAALTLRGKQDRFQTENKGGTVLSCPLLWYLLLWKEPSPLLSSLIRIELHRRQIPSHKTVGQRQWVLLLSLTYTHSHLRTTTTKSHLLLYESSLQTTISFLTKSLLGIHLLLLSDVFYVSVLNGLFSSTYSSIPHIVPLS